MVGLALGSFGGLGRSSSSAIIVAVLSLGVGVGFVGSVCSADDFALEKSEVQLGDGLSEVAVAILKESVVFLNMNLTVWTHALFLGRIPISDRTASQSGSKAVLRFNKAERMTATLLAVRPMCEVLVLLGGMSAV